ncbi:unnamed protein product [Alopecurus aequalis]
MADIPDESAGQSQAHGFGSYPLSFPSEPPDIRNWFSSYQYESPEVPELDADPSDHNGSETQDPLKYRAPSGHPSLKHAPQDGSTVLKGSCYGSRSKHAEVSATRDFLPIGGSTVEQGTKRKRSLRELFGAGLLDDHDEDTQTESRVVSPVQRSVVDPMCDFNWIGLQNRKHSHGGAAEHSKMLADSDSTIIAETQENFTGDQKTDHSKWPVNCAGNFNWIGLQNRKRSHDGAAEHSELPADSDCTIIAETQENPPRGQATDQSKQPVDCANWIGLRNRKRNSKGAVEHSELLADSDSTIIAETQENRPGCQETSHTKQQVYCGGNFNWIGLQNRKCKYEGAVENSELLADSYSTIIAETQENHPGGENDDRKGPVNCAGNFNWIGLRNSTCNYEGTVDHSELLADSYSTIIAESQGNPPKGQVTEHIKHPVNCGGTSIADTEEGFLEDGIEHSNLPVNSHSNGLADAKKPKRNLRELFGGGFLDEPDKANDSETRVVSAVQRNAVEPLANCNAAGLLHIEQIDAGAAGYSDLPSDRDVISSAETQESPQGGQVTEHNRLPVNCGSTSLAADTERVFLEDGTVDSKLPANSRSTGPADMVKTGIEHGILHANHNGVGSAFTEERSGGEQANHGKPTLSDKKAEETVAADGFIAIRRKARPAEECRSNKNPKSSKGRGKTTLQENRVILGTQNASARERTRSPLSDRTNISEAVAAPAPQVSGKWKCPSKGKPYVAPPMKQLRLEQWVRRVD